MLMDIAPAAVLGALLDLAVSAHPQLIVCNVGNFHTLAFRLGAGGINGVFEHHMGEITREQLERLMAGTLVFDRAALTDRYVAVVGPRRSLCSTAHGE